MNLIIRKVNALKEFYFFDNFISLVIQRFLKSRMSFYKKGDLHFITDYDGGDSTGARHVISRKLYDEFIIILQNKNVSIQNILDIGANNGGFVLSLMSQKNQLKKIVAVEFNYKTYLRLHFNLLYNLSRNIKIEIVNAAASGNDTIIPTTDNLGSTGLNIYSKDFGDQELYNVQGYSFNTIYKKYFEGSVIDICKIDIEGAEYELFYSDNINNIRHVRFLLIEIHNLPSQNKAELIQKIIDFGFDLILPGNSISPDVYLFENSII